MTGQVERTGTREVDTADLATIKAQSEHLPPTTRVIPDQNV